MQRAFALKATLKHVKMGIEACVERSNDADSSAVATVFKSREFREVVSIAECILKDLLLRLENVAGRVTPAMNRFIWSMKVTISKRASPVWRETFGGLFLD